VASEHGVMIPVVRGVLERSLVDQGAERRAAVERGRSGRLSTHHLDLPSATLSNLGPYGVDSFTGIIATGQTALATVGRIRPAARARDGALTVGLMMTATINADHRSFDGAQAAALLTAFADRLERPAAVLAAEAPCD
jgi:pyruvate dehydrogenase E2 component (dihydrolipoamide acetyltransferase)